MNYNPGIEDQSGSLLLKGYQTAASNKIAGGQALAQGISGAGQGLAKGVEKYFQNKQESEAITPLGDYYFGSDPEKHSKFIAGGLSTKKGMIGAAVAEEAATHRKNQEGLDWFKATDEYQPQGATPMRGESGDIVSYYLPQSRHGGTQIPVHKTAPGSNVAEDVLDANGQVIGKTLNGKFVPGSAVKPLSAEELDAGRREDLPATRARIDLLNAEMGATAGAGLLPAGSGVAGETKAAELARLKKQASVAERATAGSASPTIPQPTDVVSQARAAIARGAPRDAVISRLRQMGVEPTGL